MSAVRPNILRRSWHGAFESLNWPRIARLTSAGLLLLLGVAYLIVDVTARNPAGDFHVGIWSAGHSVLAGASPYPAADPSTLLRIVHGFITPPPLAIVGAPFSLLPFQAALGVWYVVCVAAFAGSLYLLGVRDGRIYALALVSLPMWDAVRNGQPDPLFALLACLTWRHRNSWQGGVAAGVLIAAKLLAWPLLVWMLVTRRTRPLTATAITTVGLLLGSWAAIGFRGLDEYPRLLSADARAFEAWPFSYSLVHALTPLGFGLTATRALAVVAAIAIAGLIVRCAKQRDLGWFTAALTFGLLSSPMLWPHYLLVLFVPLAISRGRSVWTWVVVAVGLWLPMHVVGLGEARTLAVLIITAGLMVWAVRARETETAPAAAPVATGLDPLAGYAVAPA